ncbi:MAG TPA: nitrate reductase molybdenum cofactor assembly chaperone [Burkholderiales bacterium]|nr:nitrate reductase molybdenum cofactor assembly chaperone [Burkholderiales bacterium]
MTKTFKALGALLTYPTSELQAAAAEIGDVIDAEQRLSGKEKAALHELLEGLSTGDVLDLQERYVALFDRGRATSLNLFEHVHGESRERGPAMVDLMQVYDRAGFHLASNELPDYLPLMLEFLSHQPFAQADDMLSDCAHIVRRLGEALRARSSHYDAVPVALLAMIGEAGLSPAKKEAPPMKEASDEKSLDEDWMDSPVIFGPEGAPDCKPAQPAASVIQFMPRSR